FDFLLSASSNCVDIRLLPHTRPYNLLGWQCARTRNLHAPVAQQSKHPEGIQDRFIHSICGQLAKTLEVGLPFKFEGPTDTSGKANLFARRKCIGGVQ